LKAPGQSFPLQGEGTDPALLDCHFAYAATCVDTYPLWEGNSIKFWSPKQLLTMITSPRHIISHSFNLFIRQTMRDGVISGLFERTSDGSGQLRGRVFLQLARQPWEHAGMPEPFGP